MPRKPTLRPRFCTSSPERSAPSRAALIYQCQACGGLVEAVYVNGPDNWCPHCQESTLIAAGEGYIPSPSLYGVWKRDQQDAAEHPADKSSDATSRQPLGATAPPTIPAALDWAGILSPLMKGPTMKTVRTHTGVFSCLACMVEYDLFSETNLKCDTCGGPLIEGHLQRLVDDDDELQGDDR